MFDKLKLCIQPCKYMTHFRRVCDHRRVTFQNIKNCLLIFRYHSQCWTLEIQRWTTVFFTKFLVEGLAFGNGFRSPSRTESDGGGGESGDLSSVTKSYEGDLIKFSPEAKNVPYSKIWANLGVLSIKSSFLIQFWVEKVSNWEKQKGTKLCWRTGSGQKAGTAAGWGGWATFSLPGGTPRQKPLTLWL